MKNSLVLDLLLPFGPIFLFIFVLHLDRIPASATAAVQTQNITFSAIFAIGDSTVDVGNNNVIAVTAFKSNFPPYGRDFYQHKATGRFSNGRLAVDFVAAKLGIKKVLPSYFERGLKATDLLTGMSFGSTGSGFDNLTSQITLTIPIWKQLQYLEQTLVRLKVEVGRKKVEQVISEALFYVSSGSEDYLLTYFHTPLRVVHYNLSEYINFVVQASSPVVRELYRMGARRIVLAGVPPLGCVPFQRSFNGRPNRACDEDVNSACLQHNSQLLKEIEKLQKEFGDCKIIFANVYSSLFNIIHNFKQFGFEEISFGCCGTGTVEAGPFCNPFSSTCKNVSTHIFWDSTHTTERVQEITAKDIVQTILAELK